MTWLIEILKKKNSFCLRDKAFNIAKNYKNYKKNMMDIKADLLQWSKLFLIKKRLVVPLHLQINLLLKMKLCQTKH